MQSNLYHNLSVVIPVKTDLNLSAFIKGNEFVFKDAQVIVVDSGGGENLKKYATTYLTENLPFWEARKLGYSFVEKPFILNLDADVVLPSNYVEEALSLLKIGRADAISIFYDDIGHCQGALEFGCSIWKTSILKKLYDFSLDKVFGSEIVKVGSMAYSTLNHGWCECTYMWRKLKNIGGKLETLPYRAKHLKGEQERAKVLFAVHNI